MFLGIGKKTENSEVAYWIHRENEKEHTDSHLISGSNLGEL